MVDFNSHAHVERDPQEVYPALSCYYFNSHAHVERDFLAKRHINHANISTHTLTWSVTFIIVIFLVCILISTHTLTWSVTLSTHMH